MDEQHIREIVREEIAKVHKEFSYRLKEAAVATTTKTNANYPTIHPDEVDGIHG